MVNFLFLADNHFFFCVVQCHLEDCLVSRGSKKVEYVLEVSDNRITSRHPPDLHPMMDGCFHGEIHTLPIHRGRSLLERGRSP